MLFSVLKDSHQSSELDHDLGIIHQWAHQWKMEFNPDHTKQETKVLFSCKKSSVSHTQLTFNGTIVTRVNNQKHLGVPQGSALGLIDSTFIL